MADTKPYVGGMTSWGNVAQLQEAAERRNAQPEVAECGHQLDQAGNVVLRGATGEAYGEEHNGTQVVNFHPEHVQTPVTHRSLPADVATNQRALTAAKPRAHR